MSPEYCSTEVSGKTLTVLYPQSESDEASKAASGENHLPVVIKNHEDYLTVLEYIAAQDEYTVEKLGELADLIEQMSLLAKGPKGDTRFMWVKYADDDTGSGMSDNPEGKKYIGLAYNKDTETPSNKASDYKWVKYVADFEGLVYENRNLISHNKDNWEQGFITVDGSESNLSSAIRLIPFMEIEPDTQYTLTAYGTYGVLYREYDRNHEIISNHQDTDINGSVTFATSSNAKYSRVYIRRYNYPNTENITPDMIGDELKVKLEKGVKSTDWTPSSEDIYEYLDAHKADKTNPHNVTKSQVGLGNVPNYTAATQSQAENGTTNAAFMTPLRTKQAIDSSLEGAVFIVDKGTNGNGNFVKWSDGSMQAYTTINLGPTTLGGSQGAGPPRTNASHWTFPANFIEKPSIQVTHALDDPSYSARAMVAFYRTADESGVNNIQAANPFDSETSRDITVDITAIGRWK